MKRIKVGIGGNGTVRIKLKKKKRNNEHAGTSEMRGDSPAFPAPHASFSAGQRISLSHPIISQMEIRVESVFRPKETDVEVVYALTGYGTSVDQLHKFTSNEVVAHATSKMISYTAAKMIEHIRSERIEIPDLIVHIHSHPLGAPVLSDADKQTMPMVAAQMRAIIPDATILFGVHAIGSEERRARIAPERVSQNTVRWSSITRAHEVAFFDEYAKPIEVRID